MEKHDVPLEMLIRDIRSIKLPSPDKAKVDSIRSTMASTGSISLEATLYLRRLQTRFNGQFQELYDSRDRARRRAGMKALGLDAEDVAALARQRREREEEASRDLGL